MVPSKTFNQWSNHINARKEYAWFHNDHQVIHYIMGQIACPLCGCMFDIEIGGRTMTPPDAIDYIYEQNVNGIWLGRFKSRVCMKCKSVIGGLRYKHRSEFYSNYAFKQQLMCNPNLEFDLVSYRGYD
uniref:Uncharacterized protein n=1 Tax=Megaviridae environmental sample TaxID=1737588 RepID=A0A5J6VJA6_9VIRU|nr:MAG: hypothetical protein [Megaviridae environmental sample]